MSRDVKVGTTLPNKAMHQAPKLSKLPFRKSRQLGQDIEHITEEMYRRNKELAEANKTLSLLRTIDALVLESHEPLKAVCEEIARAITEATDYPFAGVMTRSVHFKDELELFGWSISAGQTLDKLPGLTHTPRFRMDSLWLRELEVNQLHSLEALSRPEIAEALGCSEKDMQAVMDHLPLKSLYLMKLMTRHKLVGVIMVGFYNSTDQLGDTATLLLDRISENVGVALDNKLLFEENRHVLQQLKDSNAKLLALDEAKDDFISMASHQLRTPLTSVKGYTSLVLEGDAGKLNPQQRKLLTQSFFSSQRMVYIIADLLNVSRLKTGKFVIDPVPVNLADVVEQELEQLQPTADARTLKLEYKKPKNFPELMLDETKTRQIIMNFIDNAIYYTPAGGHVRARLTDSPTSVELRIEDDGIGVPHSEQAHLFTKFYRAGNARKIRPDGTGLGLFMAKKVIVAQNGSLIFESQEGKGSTFGFTLNKSKLAVPSPVPEVPADK